MSSQLRNLDKQMEDKEFVKAYFRGVEDGNGVTQKLVKDGVTLNSPDLIARLVGWLEEAEPSDESESDSRARAEQQLAAANLASQQEEEKEEEDETKTSSRQDSASTAGGQSSDGTTRTSTESSKPSGSSFALGSKPESK